MRRIVPVLAATPLVDTPAPAGRKLADAILGATPAPTGAYIHRTKAMPSSTESYNSDREHALWNWLEQLPREQTPRTTN
ncbi:hypothetical protein [Streptomyces sp. NPDC091212]|uniref:hypothetical protein n=1 Tax=Streptomyces sp. NPDC091212 TaxID=3155191 RepID=UPI003432D335